MDLHLLRLPIGGNLDASLARLSRAFRGLEFVRYDRRGEDDMMMLHRLAPPDLSGFDLTDEVEIEATQPGISEIERWAALVRGNPGSVGLSVEFASGFAGPSSSTGDLHLGWGRVRGQESSKVGILSGSPAYSDVALRAKLLSAAFAAAGVGKAMRILESPLRVGSDRLVVRMLDAGVGGENPRALSWAGADDPIGALVRAARDRRLGRALRTEFFAQVDASDYAGLRAQLSAMAPGDPPPRWSITVTGARRRDAVAGPLCEWCNHRDGRMVQAEVLPGGKELALMATFEIDERAVTGAGAGTSAPEMPRGTTAYVVDWQALTRLWKKRGDIDAIIASLDGSHTAFRHPGWVADGKAAVAALDAYEQLLPALPVAAQAPARAVFPVLWGGEAPLHELCSEREGGLKLAMSLSPATVKGLHRSLSEIPERTIETAYRRRARPDPEWFLGNRREFMAYAGAWRGLLAAAAAAGRGVVVTL